MKKTDNSNITEKLDLRRSLLAKYPPVSVFDCCQGNGVMWATLKREFSPARYYGVDLKSKKGRLQVDSVRFLAARNWDFDVIDVDTYGEPWAHWHQILANARQDVSVFLTIGLVRMRGGNASDALLSGIGMDRQFIHRLPVSLRGKCAQIAVPYMLNQAESHGFFLREAIEAPRSKNARYIAVRLEKNR